MLNWEAAFRVVAHEIRTPAGVIAGYARLLKGGRLDETSRNEALKQVERAAGRLGDLAQEASDLANWFDRRADLPQQRLPIQTIMDNAARRAAMPDRVHVMQDLATAAWHVSTPEPRALSVALAALIDTSMRQEARGGDVSVAARRADMAGWCDVVVGPTEWMAGTHELTEHGRGIFNFEGGGLGLRLFLGAVVFDAHGAELWAHADHQGVTGIRIPVRAEG